MVMDFERQVRYAICLATTSIIINVLVLFAVLLAWNTLDRETDFNALAISITTVEIFLVLAALISVGFFKYQIDKITAQTIEEKLRGWEDKAQETAREIAERRVEQLEKRLLDANMLPEDDADYAKAIT
jgi:predicted membrane metal-binding protein